MQRVFDHSMEKDHRDGSEQGALVCRTAHPRLLN